MCYIYLWNRIPQFEFSEVEPLTSTTLIIAVRNESKTLERLFKSIRSQTYKNLEVILVNDHSQDDTLWLLQNMYVNDCKIVDLIDGKGKKAAISAGVNLAKGELIVCTDADCTFGANWINSLVAFYQENKVNFISGPVQFESNYSAFHHFQAIELVALTSTGAASLAFNKPTMCNGANISFKKAAFIEVGGYNNIDHVASGDDILLMLKIHKLYPDSCKFIKCDSAKVYTNPNTTLKELFYQKKRWASKWKVYHDWFIQSTSVLVLLANIFILTSFFVSLKLAGFIVIFKIIIDGIMLASASKFYKIKINWILFICFQLIYPVYVLFFGIVGRMGSYKWKGRILN